MKKFLCVLFVLAMVFALAACGDGSKAIVEEEEEEKDGFDVLYADIADEEWCTVASDGSYIKIDTNPNNTEKDDFTWSYYEDYFIPADEKIAEINKDLGFSEALYEKMNSTTWSQGVQTESNDEYTVSWTYHPDKGLEVMYEAK